MAGSTYSTNLKIELMTTGENSGTWGDITNTNLGTALEQAVVGYGNVDYVSDANLTISITNSNASQPARALVLNVTSTFGSLTQTRELVVPTSQKQYIVQNNTSGGQSITVKTSAGTGITVPNGRKAHLYVNGTSVIQMFDFVNLSGGTIDNMTIGATTASSGKFTTLNASGATTLDGTVALGNAAADIITVPGTIGSNLIFTDNTYDIGASGATRPRNLFLAGAATIGGNLSVGGTLTLTGGVNLNGNVTVGDSAADTLTINATITSNLIFTDNTYDIGASGATRPRNLFLAGNATIGGSQTLTGALTVDSTTDSSSTTTGSIQTDGGVGIAKALYVGTTANIAGAVTLSGGTANGVLYLNASKQITTGTALTFDGTTLVSKGTTNGNIVSVGGSGVSHTGYAQFQGYTGNGDSSNINYALIGNKTGSSYLGIPNGGVGLDVVYGSSFSFAFQESEILRLTSTLLYTASALNVAIGASSVTAGTKFNVTGNNVTFTPNTAGKDTHTFSTGAADVGTYSIKNDTTINVLLNAGGSSYFNGGNLGVGETAPAWRFTARAASSGTVGVFAYDGAFAGTSEANIGLRFYNGGSASDIPQVKLRGYGTSNYTGNFAIDVMQGGTYPNPFIERFTVQGTNGYVGIGATAPSTNLVIGGTAASGGASGSLGAFLSRGVSTNFYEAFDGTKSFIAGVDNTQGYAKVGTLSQHPVALVAGNGNGFLYLTTSSNVSIGTTNSFNIITLPAASNGQGISWDNYANVFGEFSSGATYLSSNYYPTPGAAGYKTTITATYGAAGMSLNGTGGAGNGGLIQFFVNSATAKTAGAAFGPTEVGRFGSDGVLQVGRTSGSAPDGKLQVGATGTGAGAANTKLGFALIEDDSGNGAGLWLGSMTNENTGVIGTRTASGNLAFQTYNGGWGERMRLSYTGKLMLGTTGAPGTHMMKVTSSTEAGIILTGVNSVANDGSFTVEVANGTILMVSENNTGDGALFFCGYASATITLLSDPNNRYATSITAGRICVTKSANTGTVTITNKVGSTKSITAGKFSTSD